MRTRVQRGIGIALSTVTALLGVGDAVLMHYAGQNVFDIIMSEDGRAHKQMPTDDVYDHFFLRGWTFGFVYIVPGISGVTASLIFAKRAMVVHYAIGILALVIGSLLNTAGVYVFIFYRIVVEYLIPELCDFTDDRVESFFNREVKGAFVLFMWATGVALLAWLFLLSDLLYRGFTFRNKDKSDETSTTVTNTSPDGARETTPTISTFQNGSTFGENNGSVLLVSHRGRAIRIPRDCIQGTILYRRPVEYVTETIDVCGTRLTIKSVKANR